jgi:hypothetical protein
MMVTIPEEVVSNKIIIRDLLMNLYNRGITNTSQACYPSCYEAFIPSLEAHDKSQRYSYKVKPHDKSEQYSYRVKVQCMPTQPTTLV